MTPFQRFPTRMWRNRVVSEQLDGYVWFEETAAVEPLPAVALEAMPQTFPFAL